MLVSAAETVRSFKVAEVDFTLLHWDHTPMLFQLIFPGSSICKSFSISKSKASCILLDGLGPLLLKWTYESVSRSSDCFAIMFMKQLPNKKQSRWIYKFDIRMKNKISNYKLSCMSHFCDGTVVDMTKMFTDLNDDKTYDLLWKRLFHISVYDLSTNKAIWENLNNELQTRNNKGLIEFINCTLCP